MTRFEDVQLIDTGSGKVLWEGEAESGIDRTIEKWESPIKFMRESLDETLNRLVEQLRQFVPDPIEEAPLSGMGLKTYSDEER